MNDRLRRSVSILVEDFVSVREEKAALREENATLRAAIERVRALHISFPGQSIGRGRCMADGLKHPCPTLRALDGERA